MRFFDLVSRGELVALANGWAGLLPGRRTASDSVALIFMGLNLAVAGRASLHRPTNGSRWL
jgi:hypothetical protein